MGYTLFLDDERMPVDEAAIICRNIDEFRKTIKERGIPSHIDFDHDLGNEDWRTTGFFCAKWLIDYMSLNDIKIPSGFTYSVHSQNPIGKERLIQFMDWAIGYLAEEKKDAPTTS